MAHDPERVAQVRSARAKGGVAAGKIRALKGRRSRLDTVPALVRFTAAVIQGVIVGALHADVARVALYGVSIQRQLVETADLERRIAELEARTAAAEQHAERRRWGA